MSQNQELEEQYVTRMYIDWCNAEKNLSGSDTEEVETFVES